MSEALCTTHSACDVSPVCVDKDATHATGWHERESTKSTQLSIDTNTGLVRLNTNACDSTLKTIQPMPQSWTRHVTHPATMQSIKIYLNIASSVEPLVTHLLAHGHHARRIHRETGAGAGMGAAYIYIRRLCLRNREKSPLRALRCLFMVISRAGFTPDGAWGGFTPDASGVASSQKTTRGRCGSF